MASINKIEDIKIPADTIGDLGVENSLSFKPEILSEILMNGDITTCKAAEN